jgi:lipoate-protein ligase A
MAVDEAILIESADVEMATLRFYEWSEPTLSLGYFQRYADRALHLPSAEAACVRRQSGGGAIMHDRELTYSLALPRSHPLAADAQSLYAAVHHAIAAVLRTHLPEGVSPISLAPYRNETPLPEKDEPFLCFQRRFPGDLVLVRHQVDRPTASDKIVGSAQRRSRGAVLQHGSILLARSERAPELAGLDDLCDNTIDTAYLASDLAGLIVESVGLEIRARTISDHAFALASALQVEKYRNRLWNQRR